MKTAQEFPDYDPEFVLIDPRQLSPERYRELAKWHDTFHPVSQENIPLEEEWHRVNDLINALAYSQEQQKQLRQQVAGHEDKMREVLASLYDDDLHPISSFIGNDFKAGVNHERKLNAKLIELKARELGVWPLAATQHPGIAPTLAPAAGAPLSAERLAQMQALRDDVRRKLAASTRYGPGGTHTLAASYLRIDVLLDEGDELQRRLQATADALALEKQRAAGLATNPFLPADEWYDDDGCALWWRFPICEPPYVGSPADTDWDYDAGYTHWQKLDLRGYDADKAEREYGNP